MKKANLIALAASAVLIALLIFGLWPSRVPPGRDSFPAVDGMWEAYDADRKADEMLKVEADRENEDEG